MTEALILAAGKGSRLAPFSSRWPKPFFPLGESTIFGRIAQQLHRDLGIARAFCNLHHLAKTAQDHLNTSCYALDIISKVEPQLRGPAGSLLTFHEELKCAECIVIVSGDVIFDGNLQEMVEQHYSSGALLTVATSIVEDGSRFGVFTLDTSGRPIALREKPSDAYGSSAVISAGIYCMDPQLLQRIPYEQQYDFGADLIPTLLREGSRVSLWPLPGLWNDLGTLEDYRLAAIAYATPAPSTAQIHPSAQIIGKVHISSHVRIDQGAIVRDSVLFPGAHVRQNSMVANACIA